MILNIKIKADLLQKCVYRAIFLAISLQMKYLSHSLKVILQIVPHLSSFASSASVRLAKQSVEMKCLENHVKNYIPNDVKFYD